MFCWQKAIAKMALIATGPLIPTVQADAAKRRAKPAASWRFPDFVLMSPLMDSGRPGFLRPTCCLA